MTEDDSDDVVLIGDQPGTPGPNGNGALFGLAAAPGETGVYFVDDGTDTFNLLH